MQTCNPPVQMTTTEHITSIPYARGWGPAAEMNELRARIERLEKIVKHICPDKLSFEPKKGATPCLYT